MISKKFCRLMTLTITVALALPLAAQVQTEVPPEVQPDVLARWAANAPLAFIDQYIGNLRQYRAISLDVGDKDGLRVDTGRLHDVLDRYGITHGFEIYQGNHTSAVAVRFQNYVLPFFSKNLCFGKQCK